MTYLDVIYFFGGVRKAARMLGVSHQAVLQWKSNGISRLRQAQIELITNGALKRDDLR